MPARQADCPGTPAAPTTTIPGVGVPAKYPGHEFGWEAIGVTGVARPLPGSGVVARQGELLLVCAEGGEGVDELLAVLAEVAGAGGDGAILVRRVAALLAADAQERFPACALSGPAGDGRVAVLVYGEASAEVTTARGTVALSGVDAITSVDQLVAGPIEQVSLRLPGAGTATGRSRLDAGIVTGGGLVSTPGQAPGQSSAQAPGQTSAHAPAQKPSQVPTQNSGQPPSQMPGGPAGASNVDNSALRAGSGGWPQVNFPAAGFSVPVTAPPPPVAAGPSGNAATPAGTAPVNSTSASAEPVAATESGPAAFGSGAGVQAVLAPPGTTPPPVITPAPPLPARPVTMQPPVAPPPRPPWESGLVSASDNGDQPASAAGAGGVVDANGPTEPHDEAAEDAAAPADAQEPAAPAKEPAAPEQESAAPDQPVAQDREPAAHIEGPDPQKPDARQQQDAAAERSQVIGVYCPKGHFIDPRHPHCPVCGISLAQQTVVPQEGPRPSLGDLLLDDGETVPLEIDYVIGRDPKHDPDALAGLARPLKIVDAEGVVSRRHARISLVGWDVQIIDLGSSNGTFIQPPGAPERQQVTPHVPIVIRPGTVVTLGRRWLRYEPPRIP